MVEIGRDEFKEENVILCTIDDERCYSIYDCSRCDKAKAECMSATERILEGIVPSLPRSEVKHGYEGLYNKNNTIVHFRVGEDPFKTMAIGKPEEFELIINEDSLELREVYPEFQILRENTDIGDPAYYLFKNLRWPMMAVYPVNGGFEYYLVAPRIECEDVPEGIPA